MSKYLIILLSILSNTLLAQNIGYINIDANGDAENPSMTISNYDAIIQQLSMDSSLNTIFEIDWLDYLTEGSFYFRITHNMIYLRQGHNNPNSNNIYWTHSLSSDAYDSINSYLKSNKSSIIKLQHKIDRMNLQYAKLNNQLKIKDLDLLSEKRDSLLLLQANIVITDLNTVLAEKSQLPTLIKSSLTPRKILYRKEEIGNGLIKVIDK